MSLNSLCGKPCADLFAGAAKREIRLIALPRLKRRVDDAIEKTDGLVREKASSLFAMGE